MDTLKKSLAPIPDAAWDEINETATDILQSVLSARRFVDVDGPHGLDFGGVHTGQIETKSNKDADVGYGINKILPLVEIRAPFELHIWELDNAARGAQDIDLSNLEDAACQIASFEEQAIFYGLEEAGITGLKDMAENNAESLPKSTKKLLNAISKQVTFFISNGIEGPYSLVVNEDEWEKISSEGDTYPLRKQLDELLGGSLILSPFIDNGFLVSERGGDFKLTLGRDLSIGYHYHDRETVELYFTESFTFQCFEPAAVTVFKK